MPPPLEVVLYTRLGCGLCDDAAGELRVLSAQTGFILVERDIDRDAALRERYNDVIPVVLADGQEIARAPFAVEDLRELLGLAPV